MWITNGTTHNHSVVVVGRMTTETSDIQIIVARGRWIDILNIFK